MATHSPMSHHHHDSPHSKKSPMEPLEHTKDMIDKIATDNDRGTQTKPPDGRDSVRSVQEPASTTDELGRQPSTQKSIHHPLPFHTSPPHHLGYPGYGSPTYIIDPVNGLPVDPRYVSPTFHPPIPVDARTHEGRYHYEPHMHHPMHGHSPGVSPVLSDIPVIPLPAHQRVSPGYPYYAHPYMDQYHVSPALSMLSHARGLSPGTAELPAGSHPTYLHHISPSGFHAHPALAEMLTGGLPPGSEGHPGVDMATMEGASRLSQSPATMARRLARKRALSISPLNNESLDINTMIRTSPNSLVAYINNSRSSSTASGSYGHLSAGAASSPTMGWHPSVTPIAHLQQLQQHILKQRGPMGNPFLPPGVSQQTAHLHGSPAMATLLARAHHHGEKSHAAAIEGLRPPGHHPDSTKVWAPHLNHQSETNNNHVSSTVEMDRKQREAYNKTSSNNVTSTSNVDPTRGGGRQTPGGVVIRPKEEDGEVGKNMGEEDVPVVTDCEWKECNHKYDTLDQLVHHINNDHIHNERKEFICKWTDCIREEKPFKAQYMLVVHMRRHTGEKPHRCTFEGCTKAYSRLENLKTHLRSHTGERPYVCEFQGCTKAFSNASDRAKHQNRTHSNAKPYVCKIPGCTKRYTDPSSLRKHVKTVHGPDAHVTKKQRGDKREPPNSGKGESATHGTNNNDTTSVGLGLNSGAIVNNNNNIIKQEPIMEIKKEVITTQQTQQRSNELPKTETMLTGNSCNVENQPAVVEYSSSPHNDSGVEMNMPGGGSIGDLTAIDDDKIQDNHVSSNMGPSDSMNRRGRGPMMAVTTQSQLGARVASPMMVKNTKRGGGKPTGTPSGNRLAHRVKNAPALPPIPVVNRRPTSRGESKDSALERLYEDPRCDSSQSYGHSHPPLGGLNNVANRRGSNNSTVSSYYSSHRSSEASPYPFSQLSSRRSSEASSMLSSRRTSGSVSQFSTHVGQMNSPYDPISPGSSGRSSEASSVNGATGLPGLTFEDQRRLRAKYDEVTGKKHAWDLEVPSPVPPPVPPPEKPSRRKSPNKFKFPGRTPLPHEVPGVDNRRASDPVKSNQKHEVNLPRNNSYGQIQRNQPLPVPNNMNSLKQGRKSMGPPQSYPSMPSNGNHGNQWNQGQQQQGMMGSNMTNNNRNAMMDHGNNMRNGSGMMGNNMQNMQANNGMGRSSNMIMQNNNMGPFSPPQQQQQQQFQRQQQFAHQQSPMMQQYVNQQQSMQGMSQQQGQYTSSGMNNTAPNMANYNRHSSRRGAVHAGSFMDTQMPSQQQQQQNFLDGSSQQQYYNQGSSGQMTTNHTQNMLQMHPTNMEMSPGGCNQVTSTVMDHPMNYDPSHMDCDDPMANGLAALSTDGMDHVQQLIPDTISPSILMPPPPLPNDMGPVNTPRSLMHTSVTPVSNMVVSDMSSMLTSLAEENRYLNMMS